MEDYLIEETKRASIMHHFGGDPSQYFCTNKTSCRQHTRTIGRFYIHLKIEMNMVHPLFKTPASTSISRTNSKMAHIAIVHPLQVCHFVMKINSKIVVYVCSCSLRWLHPWKLNCKGLNFVAHLSPFIFLLSKVQISPPPQ
jgi:hypothetical protein